MTVPMHTTLFSDRLLLALMALVVWLPLANGGHSTLLYAITALWEGGILIIWLVQYARGYRRIPVSARRSWPALALLAIWLFYIALQVVPMPLGMVAAISPKAAWAHQLTYHPGQGQPWVTISVDPYRTLLSLHKSITLVLLFLLVLLLVRRFSHVRWMLAALVFAGTLTVTLGLSGYVTGWEPMHQDGGSLTATFANRNHLADYLALTIAAGIGLLLAQLGEKAPARERKESLRRALDWVMSGKMRLRAYLLLMTAGIILTRSRMGNTAFFASLLVAGSLGLLLMRRKTRGMVVLLASLVVIDIFIVGSVIGINRVVERLEKTSLDHETRDEVVRDTLPYWRDFPLTGSGLGTFRVTFPLYKGSDIPATYLRTHNDYLQFAAESGAAGLTLIGGFVVLTLSVALLALRKRRVPWAQGAAFALLMATVALLIHSTVEFNLQAIANAATYMILAALGWVAYTLPVERRHQGHATRRKRVLLAIAVGLLAAVHLVGVVRFTATSLITDHNKRLLARWKEMPELSRQEVETALDQQRLALRLYPQNVEARLVAVRLLAMLQGARPPLTQQEKARLNDQMLLMLLDATRRSPLLATSWIAIGYVRHFQKKYDALFLAAMLRAGQLAPWEYRVQLDLSRLGLLSWNRMPPAGRTLAVRAFHHLAVQKPNELVELASRLDQETLICRELGKEAPDALCQQKAQAGEGRIPFP